MSEQNFSRRKKMKKSTSLRKSALITSVIMLLVAVTALSGATYAWFSSEPVASTKEITMTTTAIQGLYLAEGDLYDSEPGSQFSTHLNWTAPSRSFAPVSSSFQKNPNFYTTSSGSFDGSYDGAEISLAQAFTYDNPDNENGTYFARKIWIKGDIPEGETRTILADFKQETLAKYHRIAIVDCSKVADLDASDVILIGSNTKTYKALGADGITNVELKPSDNKLNVNMGELKGGELKSYWVFFYFEGQDDTCTTANSGISAKAGIIFKFADEGK
jgi:hypothetical protein